MAYKSGLDGRRIALKCPTQLVPVVNGSDSDAVSYAYDPQTGALQTITDLLGNQGVYAYDERGRTIRATVRNPELTTNPDMAVENSAFDQDGQVLQSRITSPTNGGALLRRVPTATTLRDSCCRARTRRERGDMQDTS